MKLLVGNRAAVSTEFPISAMERRTLKHLMASSQNSRHYSSFLLLNCFSFSPVSKNVLSESLVNQFRFTQHFVLGFTRLG
jgi:hypothetical protein